MLSESRVAAVQSGRETAQLRFLSLREGCVAIRRSLDEIPLSGPEKSFRVKAFGCLRCIEHEASMIEELSAGFFEEKPCQRIADHCKSAAGLLTSQMEQARAVEKLPLAVKLSAAFLSLIPRLLED